MLRPRVRKADYTRVPAAGGHGVKERYVDAGPGAREFELTILAHQDLRDFAGTFTANTGYQFHDALHASYEKVNQVLSYTDPRGISWSVRFDALTDQIDTIRTQTDAAIQFLCHIVLVEAT